MQQYFPCWLINSFSGILFSFTILQNLKNKVHACAYPYQHQQKETSIFMFFAILCSVWIFQYPSITDNEAFKFNSSKISVINTIHMARNPFNSLCAAIIVYSRSTAFLNGFEKSSISVDIIGDDSNHYSSEQWNASRMQLPIGL